MKLHLPTRLRAAVLACFAVVTSFTTTLATGVLAGGAFAVAIAGSQAMAAYDATEAILSGTDNPGIFGSGNNKTPVSVPEGKVLTFAMSGDGNSNWFENSTYNADILIDGGDDGTTGMCLNNGGGGTMTFGGAVTGDGLLSKTGAGNNMILRFTGNVSEFTGNINLGATAIFTLKFESTNSSSATKGVSGTGDVTFKSGNNTLEYNYSAGNTVYITNAIVKDGGTSKVKLSGTDAVVFTKSVQIDELTTSASFITFAGGAANIVNAQDVSAALAADETKFKGTGSISLGSGVKVDLGDISGLQENVEYAIFDDTLTVTGWDTLTRDKFAVQGYALPGRTQYTLTSRGISFTDFGSVYTDMTPTGNFTWNYTDEVWNTEQDSSDAPIAFAAGDSAVFSESVAITLTGDGVTARNVLIQGDGTTVSMTENGFLTVEDMLTVANGATLTLNTSTGASGVIRGAVTVLSGGILQFNAKDVTGYNSNNTHTININEGGRLVLNINGNNETFRGTLNLDGSLEGNGRWDLYGGGAKIVTGENKNAEIATNLCLRQANSVISVGTGSTLTLKGTLSKNENNGLIKNGAGKFVIEQALGDGVIGNVTVNAGTLELLGGGNVGTISTPSTNAHLIFGGNSGTTYTAGAWNTTNGSGYSSTLTVREGVSVTMAANGDGRSIVNSWGLGSVVVNGTLTLEGNLYMHTGGNDDTTRNLITGSGVLNAASLTTSNSGIYNFSVNQMNVTGNTSIGRHVNFLGGTVNLNGNSGFFNRTTIDGGTLNLVGAFRSNANGAIYVNSGALNLKSTSTSLSDDPEQNFNNTIQVLNVAAGAAVTVDTGAVATIASATIAAPIVNKGTLTLSGSLTVSDLSGFTPTGSGGTPTYVDADGNPSENGYLSGTRIYTLIENTGTLNDDAITTVSGVTGTYEDGVLTVTAADESTFYVNTTVDATALGAGKKYRLNGGTLNVGTDIANILKTAVGSSGILNVTANCVTTGDTGLTTQFEGTLALASGVSLTLGKESAGGEGDYKVINTSSLTAVHLYGGSTLNYHGNGVTTLKNLTVKDGTATLHFIDANGDNAVQMLGVTTLTGSLDVTSQYDGAIAFERLTGAGNMTVSNSTGTSEEYVFSVSSLQGYGGKLSLTKSGGPFDATISTGTESVSFKGIAVDGSVNLALNVQSSASMSEGLSLSNGANATVAIDSGASLAGAVNVTGAGNSLTSTAGGMNLSQLNVAEGAALDLNGAVSALLMNQAGTVDIAGMSLTDGAVLTYGDAANLLSVTDGMLAGNVVIGTGLALTDDGVNLGLSSAIAQEKIGIGNYANSALMVVGDTWHLKSVPLPTVRYYYETVTDRYWVNAVWSLTDNDTSSTVSLPSDRSKVAIVFSDAGTETAPILLKLNAQQTVNMLEVVNGCYEFRTEGNNTGTITCTRDLVLGEGGHLKQNLYINASNLSMAANSSLEIGKTLNLSGTVDVTGEGAAIRLGGGQSLTTSGLNISGANSSLNLIGLSGAGATHSLGTVSLGDNTTLTLKDGATDITATATALSLGTGAAIVLEANQVLDLKAVTYTGNTGMLNKIAGAVTGAGTVLLKGTNTYTVLSEDGSAIRTNIQVKEGNLTLNSSSTEDAEYSLKVGTGGSLTLDNGATLQMESRAKLSVDGGSLTASTIQLGHTNWTQGGLVGHLELKNGNITTGQIVRAAADVSTFTMSGGTLDISGTTGIQAGIATTITGGTLKASVADGWGMTGASVGGTVAVSADSTGKVTMTNTTVTGNITGNDKLVLAGTVNATANAMVSGASVGGITVTTTDANKLTLNNTTIGSTITNNGTLEFSGTQNVTLAGSSATKYAEVYGSTDYGDNGYKSTVDVYTLVSGTAATAASDTSWQVNGVALSSTPIFDGNVLNHITEDAAGKVYYINSESVEYKAGAGCTAAEKLQLAGGKLVMSKELGSNVTITVTGSSTTLELKTELAANKLSMGTEDAATVLMGDGTLNLGTGTSLASGISLGTETDAKWAGTVKVTGASLTDANLGALGVTGSTIELDDTDGTLKGGTYAAGVELTNGSAVVLGSNNSFASLDATGGSLSIAGIGNSITSLTMANNATLELNLSKMGVKDLGNWSEGPMLTVNTLNTATPGSKLNVSALVSQEAMLTLTNGHSKVLATITNCNAALDALKLNGVNEQILTGIGGMEYKYTLERVDGTNEVNLIVKAANAKDGWVAADSDPNSIADTTWTDADTADDVKWAGVVGAFYGKGNATVHIEEDGVTMDAVDANGNPIGVIVSADANLDVSEYTFTGGMLNTALLAVNQGGLVLDNAGVNAGMYVILSNDAKLTVSADTALTVGKEQGADEGAGMMGSFVSVGGEAKLINEGTTTIHGTLSVADTAAVSNSDMLSVDAVSAEGATIHNTGTFIVAGGGIIGKLTGEGALENIGQLSVLSDTTLGSLTNSGTLTVDGDLTVNSAVTQGGTVTATNVTVNGDAAFTSLTTGKLKADSLTVKDATITTLDADKLTVGGGTVAVTDDVTLAALSGSGTLNAVGKVSLTSSVDTKVNVSAAEIELADGGNSLGSLCTDAITMPEGSKLSTESALLTVNSVSSLSGSAIGIDVSESAFAALDMLADGRYVAGNYLLIDGADSAAIFTYVNGQHLDTIIATGMNAGLTVNNGVLSLSISEITNEAGEVVGMVWDTTNGNTTTNNGVGIDTDAGFYKALDYVKQVLVSEDVTFDLSADSVGDSVAGNTSDPVSGLLIRNLSGSGELTIKGNAAAQDVATLMNTPGREISAVGLTADAATVNLGLPKGAEGYLLSDLSSTGPTLKSLNLVNRSVVNVNSNTEVLGDTDVADYARLSVKEGNMLTTGMLSGADEAEISGVITVRKGGVYTGSYDEATLVADSGSNLRLRTGGRRGMSLLVNAGGQVTLDSAAQDGSMDFLRVGESPMARAMSVGSATLNLLNTTATDDGINHSTITLTEDEGNYINKSVVTLSLGAAETARTLSTPGSPVVIDGVVDVLNSSITVNMLGNSVKNGVLEVNTESDKNLTLARFVTGGNVEGNTVTLTGTPEMKALLEKYYTNARLDSKGNIKVDRVTDYYGSRMQLSDNARVGIDMADAALVKLNPQANRGSYKDLADVLDTLDTAVTTGDSQTADELGAAVSGASVAALGAAVAGDVERQLMGIRNRTTTMGVDQTQVNENMPYFNAWINAEGDFRRMDEDGTAAGYELSSWGGTVGFDVDMTSRLTMGMAATAMYGDFTAKSADHAEGDLDTYYVTAFARYAANRWSHTFVATAGMADTSLKRTVSHAGGSYSTEGDAEAVSFGFLYELGYVVAMNESATACLQPVFNVMLSHSSLDGYSEENSDAALKMGGVDMTTVTFGMGARAQAIVGTNLYNRSSMVEGRALLKVRTGDTEAEAENALGAVPGAMGSVKAAEMGSIGAELGVGITVPMGATGGSIFADASLEVGSGYTNINGTVGYRINF